VRKIRFLKRRSFVSRLLVFLLSFLRAKIVIVIARAKPKIPASVRISRKMLCAGWYSQGIKAEELASSKKRVKC